LKAKQLHQIFKSKDWHRQWELFQLVKNWERLLGDPLGKVTYPAFFRQDVLWMFVDNSAWMQQVQFVKLDILASIRRALPEGKIDDIRFMLQPENARVPKKPVRPVLPINQEAEQQFKNMIASVENDETREALHNMWRAFSSSRANNELD